jgi:hypothetical protein
MDPGSKAANMESAEKLERNTKNQANQQLKPSEKPLFEVVEDDSKPLFEDMHVGVVGSNSRLGGLNVESRSRALHYN